MAMTQAQVDQTKTNSLAQPWMKSWPPTKPKVAGDGYAAKKGEVLVVDGSGIGSKVLQPKKIA